MNKARQYLEHEGEPKESSYFFLWWKIVWWKSFQDSGKFWNRPPVGGSLEYASYNNLYMVNSEN